MSRLRMFLSRLRGLFLKRNLEQELADEIQSHLEMQIEDYERQGMSPDEARYAALRKFGAVLLKTLPFEEPDRLLVFEWRAGRAFRTTGTSGTSNVAVPPNMRGLSL